MTSQLELTDSDYWCALITAAPLPELPERATVGILFGNGRPVHLALRRHLPRLASLVPVNSVHAIEAVLRYVADRVAHDALSIDEARIYLGPGLIIEGPRRLEVPLTDEMIATLTRRFLDAPLQPPALYGQQALMHQSLRALSAEIDKARREGVVIMKKVTPERLYGVRARSLHVTVPPIARALRAQTGRDVLIDSVKILANFDATSLRNEAMRIAEAFYIYRNRVIPELVRPSGRDLRLVGVLHAPDTRNTPDIALSREVILSVWRNSADVVIDGAHESIADALGREQDWILEPSK